VQQTVPAALMTREISIKITAFFLVLCLAFAPSFGQAPDNASDSTRPWNLHYQFTAVDQYHPPFHALYSGPKSMQNTGESALTVTSTLFTGCRLWPGGSLYCNPEVAGGGGVSGGVGAAGFPNGESFHIANPTPAFTLTRLFIRQRINLGDGTVDTLTDAANQVWEKVSPTNLTLTAGKVALSDMFDNNRYSQDPRTQFLNWSLMGGGAWDYPADTRGYTYALVTEYNRPRWSFRGAISAEPTTANGPDLEFHWGKAAGYTVEAEYRDSLIKGRPGAFRALLFDNFSRAGNYDQAVDTFEKNPTDTSLLNVSSLSHFGGSKAGFTISGDQEITSSLGAFLRVGWNDGTSTAWAFTEIDESVSPGINLSGSLWERKNDNAGLALVINGISPAHRRFLEAGGVEFIIGDGKLLHYGTENILETYYQARIISSIYAAADYQLIVNPAYNEDRGPVNVFSGRVHVEF
jgi:high affinity Mn2+ porin